MHWAIHQGCAAGVADSIHTAKPLKMTVFRITPPSPSISGGLIKTGDDVTVRFEWLAGFRR